MFEDESGVSLLPSVRATWAPRGQAPVLRHRFGWKRLSLAVALVFEPDRSDAHLVFELRPGAYNGETLIEFLTDLHQVEPAVASKWQMLEGPALLQGLVVCGRGSIRASALTARMTTLDPVEQ